MIIYISKSAMLVIERGRDSRGVGVVEPYKDDVDVNTEELDTDPAETPPTQPSRAKNKKT